MKEDPFMDAKRFEALAEAYGGDIERWPAGERPAARAYRLTDPLYTGEILAVAQALDGLLSASPEPLFAGVLRERLLAQAPRRPAWRGARAWLSGAGLAAACAAGVLFGANVSGRLASDPTLDGISQASSSFDATAAIVGLEDVG
jgi:hypothetical protein